jgi:hypothetical protein
MVIDGRLHLYTNLWTYFMCWNSIIRTVNSLQGGWSKIMLTACLLLVWRLRMAGATRYISSFSYACLECTGTTVLDSAYELHQTGFLCKVNGPVASGISFLLRETADCISCSQEPTTDLYHEPCLFLSTTSHLASLRCISVYPSFSAWAS